MNIIIGSIVLCKIIVADPTTVDQPVNQQSIDQTKIEQVADPASQGNQQISNIVGAISRQPTPQQNRDIAEKEKKKPIQYSLITGVVEAIKDFKYLKEVPEFNKYKYETETSYIVKTVEFEKILVKSTACGLADQYIVTDNQLSEIQQKKKDIELLLEKRKADELKEKEAEKKIIKVGNATSNDIIKFIPANEKVPAGYVEVVTDAKTRQEMINAALKSMSKKTPQEIYLDQIAKDQKDLFVKKVEKKVEVAPVIEKKVEVKEDTSNDLQSVDVAKLLDAKKKEEKEQIIKKQEEVVDNKKEQESVVEKQVDEVKVKQQKEDHSKKKIILDDNKEINSSGSIIKDALDFGL